MEFILPPLSNLCLLSQRVFLDGERVVSVLWRDEERPEVQRADLLEEFAAQYRPSGKLICRWVQTYKPKSANDNRDRTLKLTAESLFFTLADPATEASPENTRLLQFLALMLERKRLLKPRGKTMDGSRQRYEHTRTKQVFELPIDEMSPEFFVQVRDQLSILVGGVSETASLPPASPLPATEASGGV